MKTNTMKYFKLSLIPVAILALTACGGVVGRSANSGSHSQSSLDAPADSLQTISGDLIGGGPGAGSGANVAGVGALSAPTADAVVARLSNVSGLSPGAGNFARALAQVKSNLPKVTDPIKATGFDQVQLLAYGMCSDDTTAATPGMQTKYGITKAGTIAAQNAALIAAGVKILDGYVAGLASQSSASAAVNAALQNLVTKVGAVQGNNSTIAFMSVCIAAHTAGSSMMGF